MKEINEENLDTAIALGDAVCNELGICCDTRGRVIFQIYKKLEEVKLEAETAAKSGTGESTSQMEPPVLEKGSESSTILMPTHSPEH